MSFIQPLQGWECFVVTLPRVTAYRPYPRLLLYDPCGVEVKKNWTQFQIQLEQIKSSQSLENE